ncbi:MAG: biotin carboxylase N-terminal domain-containing protein [Beijerinckiaceae bacterium]|nr:biotin carboxylase N-terminal domain-containing protein [Beijerinckiaceae bacterium]
MIRSVLIANRGEIACRIIRTARRLGIRTVAVFSEVDAEALHVRSADVAVCIGAPPAIESYLVGERIIAAAMATQAEAVHPGYGFLSENAEFAQSVVDAGLVWIGPRPASIRAMGLKDAAKRRMQAAGVATVPGYLGDDQSPDRLASEAAVIGYPVLIKAAAGGGGKGMRKVDDAADFADALSSCQREAAAAFRNDQVLLEKWVTSPRHIEVQVFGDTHGNVVHLFERDCSLQRRHQKVIEEAPAPGMDPVTREAICAAAVRAAKAVDYVGAGTIEFIADASEGLRADRIWFMEMNTRLQVEHPVTEEITGQDLVEWQFRVASGEALPKTQDELSIVGWAMEARLYAEDPSKGFLPSTGPLDAFAIGAAHRIDTGVEQGGAISPFYDPMIAKVIARGTDRDSARRSLAASLAATVIWPLKTNAGFLVKILEHPAFVDERLDTGLIGREGEALIAPDTPSPAVLAAAASRLVPQSFAPGFRLNAPPVDQAYFLLDRLPIQIRFDPRAAAGGTATATMVSERGQTWRLTPWRTTGVTADPAADGSLLAPMSGRVTVVGVSMGERVKAGRKLVVMEAMKMEYSLVAPFDGIVAELDAVAGSQVADGAMLVRIEREEGA